MSWRDYSYDDQVREAGYEEGYEEGYKKGYEESILKGAKWLLESGKELQEVVTILGLTEEQIEALKAM